MVEGGRKVVEGGRKEVLVPTSSWYQDLRRAREAEPLGMQGGTGGCRPPARGSGGLESPQEQQGLGGGSPPVKTILRYYFMVKPIHPLSDKVFERPGL